MNFLKFVIHQIQIMAEAQVIKWINQKLHLENIKCIAQFANGYQFGRVLSALGLQPNLQSYINKFDDSCVYNNYKNTIELIRIEGITKKPLYILECIMKVNQFKKLFTKAQPKKSQIFGEKQLLNKLNEQIKDKTGYKIKLTLPQKNYPKKILKIESQLEKFREQKIRHQIKALKEKAQFEQQQRNMQQNMRYYEMNKLKKNKDFIKQQDIKIYQGWVSNQKVKQTRIERDQFFAKREENFKTQVIDNEKKQDQKEWTQSVQYFTNNCARQGILIKHDPDHPPAKIIQKEFNSKVKMQVIRAQVELLQHQKKERTKRKNRMAIQQQNNQKLFQLKYDQQNLLKRIFQEIQKIDIQCQNVVRSRHRKELHYERRKKNSLEAQDNLYKVFQANIDKTKLLQAKNNQIREREWAKKKIQYREINLEKRIKKYQMSKQKVKKVLSSMIQMVHILNEFQEKNSGQNSNKIQIPVKFWREMCSKFINNQPYKEQPSIKLLIQNSLKQSKIDIKDQSKYLQEFLNYYYYKNQWKNIKQIKINYQGNIHLANFLGKIVQLLYPQTPNNQGLPISYLNLKIALVGNPLSGKSTLAKFLIQKYSLAYIDPTVIRKQIKAKQRAQEQQEIKTAKKTSKKDMKKEIVIVKQPIKFDQQQVMIINELKEKFPQQNFNKLLQEEYQIYAKKEMQKQEQTSKKAAKVAPKKKQQKKDVIEQQYSKIINDKDYYYIKGYIVQNVNNWEKVQEAITGQKKIQYRLNPQKQYYKQKLSQILPPYQYQVIQYPQSAFNFYINVICNIQQCKNRGKNRKIDPLTGIVYLQGKMPVDKVILQRLQQMQEIQEIIFDKVHVQCYKNICYVEISNQQRPIDMMKKVDEIIKQYLQKMQKEYDIIRQNIKIQRENQIKKMENLKLLEEQLNLKKNQQVLQSKLQEKQQQLKQKQNLVEINKMTQNQQHQQIKQQQNIQQAQLTNQDIQEIKKEFQLFSFIQLQTQQCKKLLNAWMDIQQNYILSIQNKLIQIKTTKHKFFIQLQQLQLNFLEIILRPSDRSYQIQKFQDNYNKLIEQKRNALQFDNSKRHLIEKLDNLYEDLWKQIQATKDQAISKRKFILTAGWIQKEMEKVVMIFLAIFQIEINKITQTLQFLINYKHMSFGIGLLEISQHILLDPFPNNKSKPQIQQENSFPMGKYLFDFCQQQIQKIYQYLENKQNKFKRLSKNILVNEQKLQKLNKFILDVFELEKQAFLQRLQLLDIYLFSIFKQYRAYFFALENRMDDWIIFSIKNDSNALYEVVKKIKMSIKHSQRAQVLGVFVQPINQSFKIIKGSMNPCIILPFQNFQQMTTQTIKMIVVELKSIKNENNKIPYNLFKDTFSRRIKSNQCNKYYPQFIKQLNGSKFQLEFPYIEQCLVQNDFIRFEQIALLFILIRSNIPYADQVSLSSKVQQYFTNLLNYSRKDQYQTVGLEDFIEVNGFYEKFECDQNRSNQSQQNSKGKLLQNI